MNVWVAIADLGPEDVVVGVFSSEEQARSAVARAAPIRSEVSPCVLDQIPAWIEDCEDEQRGRLWLVPS